MESWKLQELASLIDEATASLEIRSRAGQKLWSPLQYRVALGMIEASWLAKNRYGHDVSSLRRNIKDTAAQEAMVSIIRRELSEYIHEGRTQTSEAAIAMGRNQGGFSIEDIVFNLLDAALMHGAQEASETFYKLLNEESTEYQRITVIRGAQVQDEIEIAQRMRLVPLPSNTKRLPTFLPILGDHNQSGIEYLNSVAIVETVSVSPKFINPERDTALFKDHFRYNGLSWPEYWGHDYFHQEWCEAISIVANCAVVPVLHGHHNGHDQIFKPRHDGILSGFNGNARVTNGSSGRVLTPVEIEKAGQIFAKRKNLSDKDKDRLRLIIQRWTQSKTRNDDVEAFIDLGIVMESLYLPEGKNRNIGSGIRRNAAWHIGGSSTERQQVSSDCKAIYDMRSNAAHTGRISREGSHELKNRGQEICRQSIVKIIENNGFPQWGETVKTGDGQ